MESKAYEYVLRTPSPKRRSSALESPATFSDRLIPSRAATDLPCGFGLLDLSENSAPPSAGSQSVQPNRRGKDNKENANMYEQLLQSELLGNASPFKEDEGSSAPASPGKKRLFHYKSELEDVPPWFGEFADSRCPVPLRIAEHAQHVKTPPRNINKTPLRVMDAPQMLDDFYLNLIDWSNGDDLAVALGNSAYAWNATSNRVHRVCELSSGNVSSVSWATRSAQHLGVGTSSGDVQIWDKEKCKKIRSMKGHRGNVCSLAWNGFVLSTGGRDGLIVHRDIRQPEPFFCQVRAHKSQVCGLKWSCDEQRLASGSDDCRVCIWDLNSTSSPVLESSRHKGAVKALAWSPHQAGLIATGGGVADKRIQLWNTTNDVVMKEVDTGSQVCNLAWSKNVNEIVSTHGYSLFEVAVWRCPSMSRVATLTGHSRRVLYLTMSPDGRKIATGSGDLTVRTWDLFPPARAAPKSHRALHLLPSTIR